MWLKRTLVLFLVSLSTASAQEGRASIAGLVTDPSGAAVPGAAITVQSLDRNTQSSATGSESGRYQVAFLLPGKYSITVEAPGFKRYVNPAVELATAEKLGLDIRLEVGVATESVTVTEAAGLVETESAQRGSVITSKELHDLPNQGRSVFQMVWAVAGVTRTGTGWGSMSPQGVANATGFSLNGGRPGENEVLLDGVSDVHGGRQVKNIPSLETVEEFKVIANPYDSSFGRTGGGAISFTTKAGTNQIHGVAWEFLGNNKLNANAWQLNRTGTPRAQSNVNIFGFEVDGPVYLPKLVDGRNKFFFMFSNEGWRFRGVDIQQFTIPLAEQRNGDFSRLFAATGQAVAVYDPSTTRSDGAGGFRRDPFAGNRLPASRISPIAAKAASFLPTPTFAGQGPGQVNNYVRPTMNRFGINQQAARIDYNVTSNNRVYFRYSNTPFEEIRALGWGGENVAEPSGNAPLTRNGVNWSFDWTSTLRPRTMFNVRFGLTRWEDFAGNLIGRGYNPRDLGFPDSLVSQFKVLQFPRFDIAGGYAPIGSNRPGNLETDYAYSLQPNLNLVRGGHVIKMGAEFRRFEKNRIGLGLISGQYSFGREFTQANPLRADALSGNEFASFLLGVPNGGRFDSNMHPAYKFYYYSGFIQDDWKLIQRLTLNLGFRWDYEAPLSERYNRQVRGFAFDQPASIANRVQGLRLTGGLLYAGTSGNARQAFNRDLVRPQPRVGVAYKISDNWVLRGGYGLFFLGQYEEGPGNGFSRSTPLIASNDGGLTPRVTLANPFPEPLLQPVGSSLGLATDLGLGLSPQYLDRKLPYSHQVSFGFQTHVRGWVIESAYQGNFTRRLAVAMSINNIPVAELGRASSYYTDRITNPMAGLVPDNASKNGATIPRQDLLIPFPHFAGINLTNIPIGRQGYHGWQNSVKRRFSKGYTIQAAYTVSKTLEAVSPLNAQDFNASTPLQSGLEQRLLEWDVPEKLAVLGTYELPIGRGKKYGTSMGSFLNAIAGGWQLNGNVTRQSGFPAPFPNAAPVAARSAALGAGERTRERWFDVTLWRDASGRPVPVQAPFTLRNFPTRFGDVRLPMLNNLDLSLFKDFAITERMKLNFRAEWYNITNTPWFPRLDTTSITAANFGSLNLSQTNTPKRAVLGLRLLW
jgi:hypothetical protein